MGMNIHASDTTHVFVRHARIAWRTSPPWQEAHPKYLGWFLPAAFFGAALPAGVRVDCTEVNEQVNEQVNVKVQQARATDTR